MEDETSKLQGIKALAKHAHWKIDCFITQDEWQALLIDGVMNGDVPSQFIQERLEVLKENSIL